MPQQILLDLHLAPFRWVQALAYFLYVVFDIVSVLHNVNYDCLNLGYPRPSAKCYMSEAKCSCWIIHSMTITLSKGLIAVSVLPCSNTLSSDP